MPSSCRPKGSGDPIAAVNKSSHAARSAGKSRAWNMIALLVPPRMKTAGMGRCRMEESFRVGRQVGMCRPRRHSTLFVGRLLRVFARKLRGDVRVGASGLLLGLFGHLEAGLACPAALQIVPHAELQPADEGVYVVDLESTNGSYINEQRLTPQVPTLLQISDRVRFGDKSFTLQNQV